MVRPTSAADINSLGPLREAASPTALMRDLDLLLRLSGRIVKGCRLPGSLALLACANDLGRAGLAPAGSRDASDVTSVTAVPEDEASDVPASERLTRGTSG